MDENLLRKLVRRIHNPIPSPGDSTFILSPTNPRKTVELAVIHLHRFAFYYWLQWTTDGWRKSLTADNSAPDLVTIDYHDDVGVECDCVFPELSLLVGSLELENSNDEQELKEVARRRLMAESNVAAYSVLGLRALNDGHIYPAQYLNAVGDVFVLYKQGDDDNESEERSLRDQFGNEHRVRHFTEAADLIAALAENPNRKTYFDLDVDYFFEDKNGIRGMEEMIPVRKIRQLMNPKSDLMRSILERDLRGVTFALEPTYCGGLPGCFKAMSVVMESLFTGDLLGGRDLKWK